MIVLVSIFFFQAEDGIRDTSVTGVQTCALPISANFQIDGLASCRNVGIRWLRTLLTRNRLGDLRYEMGTPGLCLALLLIRSEERRVGKECSCRWWSDSVKKQVNNFSWCRSTHL